MAEFRPAVLPHSLIATVDGAFLSAGADADVDAAFDDAVEAAWVDYGRAEVVPSVACADASSVRVLTEVAVPQAVAVQRALRQLTDGSAEPGVVYALPICRDAQFRRRRVVLRSEDPTVELGRTAGVLAPASTQVLAHCTDLLSQTAAPLVGDELIESVEVRRVRAWYKTVATAHRGRTVTTYAVQLASTGQVVADGFAKAGDARREAVALCRAGAVAGQEQVELEVVAVPRREGGLPLVSIARNRVKQKATLKVTIAAEKDPSKTKTAGWVFFGVLPAAAGTGGEDRDAAEQ